MSERSKKNDHYGKLDYNKAKRWAKEHKQKEKRSGTFGVKRAELIDF